MRLNIMLISLERNLFWVYTTMQLTVFCMLKVWKPINSSWLKARPWIEWKMLTWVDKYSYEKSYLFIAMSINTADIWQDRKDTVKCALKKVKGTMKKTKAGYKNLLAMGSSIKDVRTNFSPPLMCGHALWIVPINTKHCLKKKIKKRVW